MKIIKSESKTEIKVAPNKDWKFFFVFVTAGIIMIPFFVLALFAVVTFLVKWNFGNNSLEIFGILLLSFIMINYSLWLLIGKEKVVFRENIMSYSITNGIFRITKHLETNSIKNLKTAEKVFNSELPFIKDSGRIKFYYKGKHFDILRGLKDDEIKNVGEIFKEQINKNSP